ncbi:hypothetical protein PIB30_007007 [Stylosanthes scabra]|uniref:Uncharacterized protein n=1 Tax=Stylosanthes scabra TaxID=79078 RepID=A0ABU6Z1I3_9FABA|nr:hypothetical protein [Stylosanthes scabra]
MSGKSSVYNKFKAHLLSESKKSTSVVGTGSGGSKPTSSEQSVPTTSGILDSSSAKNASATPSPSIQSTQEADKTNKEPPQSRKRKVLEPKYGHINSKEFDHAGFAQEYLLGGNSRIPMDGENFIKNLEVVTRSIIKAAAICQATQNKMKGCVIVPEVEVVKLRNRVKVVEAEKRVIEGRSQSYPLRSRVCRLTWLWTPRIYCNEGVVEEAGEGKVEGEEKYRKLYAEFKLKIEDQTRLEVELQAAQDMCDKFFNDAMLLVGEVVGNSKEQLRVILPDFDINQIGPDHKVVDGIIIPSKPPIEEQLTPEEEHNVPAPTSENVPTSEAVPPFENVPISENSPEAQPTMSDPPPTPC